MASHLPVWHSVLVVRLAETQASRGIQAMAHHVKVFEWLMYASLVLSLGTALTEDYTAGEITLLIALTAFAAWLVRLAARKDSRVAACLLGTFTVFGILILIADVSGGAILSFFATDPLPSTGTLVLDAIAVALMTAAMVFYLTGDRGAPQP